MNKRAKLAILGIAAAFILVVGIFVVSTYLSSAQDWSEYLKLEYNTDNCFTKCEAIFTVTNPSPLAISLGSSDVRIWSEVAKGPGLTKPIEVYREEDISYEVEVPEYGKCSYTDGNGTLIEYKCQTGSHKETKTEKQFVPFDFAGKTLSKGEKWRIKLVGYKKPMVGENNVEWLIDFKGMQPPWASWYSNYKYRRNNTVNSTIPLNVKNIPVPINGTSGLIDSNNRELVWCLLDDLPGSNVSSNIILYYNNISDYRCVNASNDVELPIETEMGNGTSWNLSTSKALWQANYTNYVFHFNNSVMNSLGGNGTIVSNLNYNDSGLIGTAIQTGSGGYVDIGNVPEAPKFSMETWLKLNALPASGVHFFIDDWDYGAGGKAFSLGINGNGDLVGRCGDGSGDNFATNFTFDLNKWHQIVITGSDQEHVKVYVDGRMVAEPTADYCHIITADTSLTIGGDFSSEIDEARIYNTTLTQNEIRARYEIVAHNWSILQAEELYSGAYANESVGDDAILQGIKNTTICNQSQQSLCTDTYVHASQQVYTVNGSGVANQDWGRFDYVFINLNQTWALNYISANENTYNFTNMVNMTPVFYVWEAEELNYSQIREQVTNLIDATNQTQ